MARPKSGMGRDLGIRGNGAGKGDVDRTTDVEAYRKNLEDAFRLGKGWSAKHCPKKKLATARSVAARAFLGGSACSSDH